MITTSPLPAAPLSGRRRAANFAAVIAAACSLAPTLGLPADPPPAPVRQLAEFGPLGTAAEVKAAYGRAKEEMAATGGILLVPPAAAPLHAEDNVSQISPRDPAPPAETKSWKKSGPAITVVVVDPTGPIIRLPQVEGLRLERTMRMPAGESLPHWTTDYALNISNHLVHGPISYSDVTVDAVKAGPDAKFYVRTIRGLRPGMFLNGHATGWYGGKLSRLCIKTIGYDPDRKLHFFTADTAIDHEAGAAIQNKNNEGLVWMNQVANCDEQTYDVMLNRRQYGLGDTYLFFGRFKYMSNIHSARGDENGNIFGAYSEHETNNFTGTVAAVDWRANTLAFRDGKNVETLATSRPIINLNRKKWIDRGTVMVVPAESYWEAVDTGRYPFEGRTYPSQVIPTQGLRMGGLIRGAADCPWDESIVGRWIGITEPTELIAERGRSDRSKIRWFQIDGLHVNPDGTKDITVQRFWWGARSMGSINLYRLDNHTWDGHVRALSYAIAPGTYAADVSRAVPGKGLPTERLIGVAPYGEAATPLDFEPGDPVEQAIGPEPFKPTGMRLWCWDNVPGVYPAAMFDLANHGADPRHAAMFVHGGPTAADALDRTAAQAAPWKNIIVADSCVENGIHFKGDVTHAALLFQQPTADAPIRWVYGPREAGAPERTATLTVSRDTGDLRFEGGDARFSGAIRAQGITADDKPARNLRGKRVPVAAGATSLAVEFPRAEVDADYAVFLEQSWLTSRGVVSQTETGFEVAFEKPAPAAASLHWMIVR